MTARGRTRLVLLAMALVLAAAAVDGWRWHQAARLNDSIRSGQLPPEAPDEPAALRFARAHALAASGAGDQALDRYRSLQEHRELGTASRYNSANLLMRQAIEVRRTQQPGQAIPLIELAKESYRDVLRQDPAHWAARYNLERAQRLLPDPEDEEPPATPPRDAERAPTTMRAYAPGLP